MKLKTFFNEMYEADGSVRPHYSGFCDWLKNTPPEKITQNRQAADLLFHRVGITFAVYGEATGTERLIPFDIVPHVIPGAEWERISAGLTQRVTALNAFLVGYSLDSFVGIFGASIEQRAAAQAAAVKERLGG